MPKMKVKGAVKKRLKVTGSGKIKRAKGFHSHILTKKSKKRKRNLTYSTIVDKADAANVKEMLRN